MFAWKKNEQKVMKFIAEINQKIIEAQQLIDVFYSQYPSIYWILVIETILIGLIITIWVENEQGRKTKV